MSTATKAASTCTATPVTPEEENVTELERDLLDWGFVFGVAFGIARGEDAFESLQSVAARAHVAARVAYARWASVTGEEADVSIFNASGYLADRRSREQGQVT